MRMNIGGDYSSITVVSELSSQIWLAPDVRAGHALKISAKMPSVFSSHGRKLLLPSLRDDRTSLGKGTVAMAKAPKNRGNFGYYEDDLQFDVSDMIVHT